MEKHPKPFGLMCKISTCLKMNILYWKVQPLLVTIIYLIIIRLVIFRNFFILQMEVGDLVSTGVIFIVLIILEAYIVLQLVLMCQKKAPKQSTGGYFWLSTNAVI